MPDDAMKAAALKAFQSAAKELDYQFYKACDTVATFAAVLCEVWAYEIQQRRIHKRAKRRWLKRQSGDYAVGRN